MAQRLVTATGHLIDTGLMSRYLGAVVEGGGSYEILRFDVGKTRGDYSTVEIQVEAKSLPRLNTILANLATLGCHFPDEQDVTLKAVTRAGVAPDDFYSTTHHRTRIRHQGRWLEVKAQRMDGMIVVKGRQARCTLLRDLKKGDRIVCGLGGVEAYPPFEEREAEGFSFMKSETSSERAVELKARDVAETMREMRRQGRDIVVVAGPVVVHTGAGPSLCKLIARGWVDGLLAGNALAVHDVERALHKTSLGIDLDTGLPAAEGHMNHLRAINTIRRAGSLKRAVLQGVLKSGIMKECVEHDVPFSLAGSIRDDGPLPDTEMDLIKAQSDYARLLKNAGLVLILSTMLHGIGVGNMTRSDVIIVCVDIHQGVVTKLLDRGSAQTLGVVTDVSGFLHRLEGELKGRSPGSRPGSSS